MDELMKILEELRPDVDFEAETGLVSDGILDSFDIVSLVAQLNETFDIEIGPVNLVPENFNSAEVIWTLVEQLQDE
jgi:acyl carrier protein